MVETKVHPPSAKAMSKALELAWGQEHRIALIKHLVRADVENAARPKEWMLTAGVKEGNMELVQLLLTGRHALGGDAHGSEGLVWAIRDNNHNMVELLLEYGARPDDQDGLPLKMAKEYSDATMVALLKSYL